MGRPPDADQAAFFVTLRKPFDFCDSRPCRLSSRLKTAENRRE
jgi:hypothetical protein